MGRKGRKRGGEGQRRRGVAAFLRWPACFACVRATAPAVLLVWLDIAVFLPPPLRPLRLVSPLVLSLSSPLSTPSLAAPSLLSPTD